MTDYIVTHLRLTAVFLFSLMLLFSTSASAQSTEKKFMPLLISTPCVKNPGRAAEFIIQNDREAAVLISVYYERIGKADFISWSRKSNPKLWEGRDAVMVAKIDKLFEDCLVDIDKEGTKL